MDEVYTVAGNTDQETLKLEGDKAIAEFKSSGQDVFVDESFDFETAKGGYTNEHINFDYERVAQISSNVNDASN